MAKSERHLFQENCCDPVCEKCGRPSPMISYYKINGCLRYLCPDCSSRIEATFKNNKKAQNVVKSNFPAGLTGAFLGGLIGVILWVFISLFSNYACVAGGVTAICAILGFSKLSGRLTARGLICSLIITAIMIYVANGLAWILYFYDSVIYNYDFSVTFWETSRTLKDLLTDNELSTEYSAVLITGYFLAAVCSIKFVINVVRNAKARATFKKMP